MEISEAALANVPQAAPCRPKVFPWLALSAILLLHATFVAWIHPTNFFGLTEDDSIYFSSAKALADGKGYILPSVPGTPPATKYPILYPWLLSWLWRWNPSFPANLSAAVALNVLFGFAFLTMAFIFLRQLKLSDAVALLLTAFCAVHPLVLFYTANLVADMPFAALGLAAIVLGARSVEPNTGLGTAALSGVLAGLSLLLRALGAPVAAGVYLVLLLRGGWRKSTAFAVSAAPFFVAFFWRSIVSVPQQPPVAALSCVASWNNTWLYYTNYPAFWKVAAIDNHTFWQNVQSNVKDLVLQLSAYVVEPRFIGAGALALVLTVFLGVTTVRGMARQIPRAGWHIVYLALGFYLVPVLIWDYTTVDRFLLPFLPLFLAGFAVEAEHLIRQVRASIRSQGHIEARIAAVFFCLAGAGVLAAATVSWWREASLFRHNGEQRAALLPEKQEAYRWLRENSRPEARFIAYEDASAFLYSGRQGLRPTTFLPAGAYRPEVLDADLSCLASSAKPIGASYWIMADDDFGFEWGQATRRAVSRESEMSANLHLLFRSRQGHVRVYGLVPASN